jgi:hypothetical protein
MLRKLFTANSTTPLSPLLGNERQTGRKFRSNWASPEIQKKRTNTSATPHTFATQITQETGNSLELSSPCMLFGSATSCGCNTGFLDKENAPPMLSQGGLVPVLGETEVTTRKQHRRRVSSRNLEIDQSE